MNPYVQLVHPLDDYQIEVVFENGERQTGGGTMICEFCGGETRKKKVKRQHWLQGKLVSSQ
ncbi:MAG: hypothetical protein QME81_00680 [bacterium]|nr:hypothetical protein [bacterium]